MREILFRGKRLDNCTWAEGSLSMEYFHECGCVMISPTSDTCYKVEPETVGQFTGLTDKNGKKIFEGDIIKGKLPDFSYMPERTGVVQWGNFGWIIKFDAPEWEFPRVGFCSFGDYEVIGNIHDNPELMEGT